MSIEINNKGIGTCSNGNIKNVDKIWCLNKLNKPQIGAIYWDNTDENKGRCYWYHRGRNIRLIDRKTSSVFIKNGYEYRI